ncbi:hypothetical protein [Microbacterium sp. P04]|uniref:hypothetical protein n=1 Tax=Microbacterium sp. P04 TaxID=3366947 RepID=UPI003746AEB8
MIAVGLILGAIGLADAFRPLLAPRRQWIVLAAIAVVVFVVGLVAGSPAAAVLALVCAALWVWLVPLGGRSRAGFWPAVGLAVVCALCLALGSGEPTAGVLSSTWRLHSPVGPVSLDQSILVLGIVVFLLESANAVVRVALAEEGVETPADPDHDPGIAESPSSLKGGRLIGPIERVIVLSLTLATAYPLLAAFIAAKGIVRFPEISRDSGTGNRAEYFLIGSLVSWLQALAGAFMIWWAFAGFGR